MYYYYYYYYQHKVLSCKPVNKEVHLFRHNIHKLHENQSCVSTLADKFVNYCY